MNRKVIPLESPINAHVHLPASLSYTIRALALAALTKGSVTIANALKSDDTAVFFNALKTLGIKSRETVDGFVINGNVEQVSRGEYTIDIKLSGRSARMILPLLCMIPGKKILTCSEPFKRRPMGELVTALRTLGANIEYGEKEGYLPLVVTSQGLIPKPLSISGSISSQYITALLMIAPVIGGLELKIKNKQTSKPFIDTTIDIMKSFGVIVTNDVYKKYVISQDAYYQNPKKYTVETDTTAASYFMAFAAINRSSITIHKLPFDSKQGDLAFAKILEQMGCKITRDEKKKTLHISGMETLNAITVDMNSLPDVVPTLAVVAAFAQGKTNIINVANLKIKESDRLEAIKTELLRINITAETTDKSLIITGGYPEGAEIKTYNDHRIAMAFAIVGTRIQDIIITKPNVVTKSFPTFWETLRQIGVRTEETV